MPLAANAQEQALTLDECVSRALAGNLRMKSGETMAARARDMQGTAFDMEKTSIALSQDPTSGGSPDNGLSVSQTFEFPTVYAARRRYLKAETDVARSSLGVTRNEVVKDVRACYYALLHSARRIAILQSQDSLCRQFVKIATAKLNGGEGGRLELINAERMLSENAIEMQKAIKKRGDQLLTMRRLLNTDTPVVPADTALAPITRHELPADSLTFASTPLGEMAASQVAASERSLSLARQAFMPSLSIGATSQLLIKGFNPYDVDRARFDKGNLMALEVGVSVPLFFGGQRARLKAARRDVELAELGRRQAEAEAQSSYRACLNELVRAKKVVDYYDSEGNSHGQQMARLSKVAYENGEISYTEYIQNLQASLDVQLRYANAVDDYNQAIIMLDYLKGTK